MAAKKFFVWWKPKKVFERPAADNLHQFEGKFATLKKVQSMDVDAMKIKHWHSIKAILCTQVFARIF